jgi:hypothetical protein
MPDKTNGHLQTLWSARKKGNADVTAEHNSPEEPVHNQVVVKYGVKILRPAFAPVRQRFGRGLRTVSAKSSSLLKQRGEVLICWPKC